MELPIKKTFWLLVAYFAGIAIIFPLYLGLTGSFSGLLATLERVLYVSPSIVPSPLGILFIFLPAVLWNAWERGEGSKAFFYAALFLFALYAIFAMTPLTLRLAGWFILGFLIALGIWLPLGSWRRSGVSIILPFFVIGPLVYWLFVAYV